MRRRLAGLVGSRLRRRPVQDLCPALVPALAACLGLALGAAGPAAAQDRSIVIEEMHAVFDVQQDGDVSVEERYTVRFEGSWNGLLRIVDLRPSQDYPWDTPAGFDLRGATSEQGAELRTEVSRDGRYLRDVRIYVPDASDRTARVSLHYTLEDVLAFYAADRDRGLPAMDELYWSVTGTAWEVPILEASAEVRLPMQAQVAQAAGYRGGSLSSDSAPTTIDGSVARFTSGGRLDPGEGLSIGVGWPAGTVQRDPTRVMQWGAASLEERLAGDRPGPLAYLPGLLPFVVFWFAYRAWDRRGRDPEERAIMVRWEPPADLSPAEAGTLVDHSPEMHDIISTLVEMAVKGYVVIEEREKEGLLKFGSEYVFHLVRPESEWGELLPHQERFLRGLFKHRAESVGSILKEAIGLSDDATEGAPPGATASVKLSDLKNEFYEEIPDIKDAIFRNLVRKGHYLSRPDKARNRWLAGAAVVGVLGFMSFTGLVGSGTVHPLTGIVLGVALVLSALILGFFGFLMPARTEKGARTREAALGFKQFLEKVENPRYKRMITSPDQFEEYLPYAMAFECQEEWAKAFDDLLTEPPDWYHGHHHGMHFRPSAFAADMSSMASTAGTAMASSPSSSGSGGGGSVGGAGGSGGGGGGF
ncbi:MAG: DUF2207 domain-containing protein [Longimicrobiales bacterium]|nr:DUF2207 domain-containing protein [Longimicrobiales bacterium]